MATSSALSPELVRFVEQVSGEVLAKLYGPTGTPALGTLFDEIESAGVEVGDAVSRAIVQAAVQRQAAQTPADVCSCGTPLEERDPEPRSLTTRRGEIGWMEPLGHCKRCRRAFFPSESRLGPAGE
jgi:hypothetical protein